MAKPIPHAHQLRPKIAAPATPTNFIGVWQGYSDDGELEFIRLKLSKGGLGAMVLSELPNSSDDLYLIHWQQLSAGSYDLSVHAKIANHTSEPITLRDVSFDGFVLRFRLDGNGWHRHFVLFNEKTFTQRAQEARHALSKMPVR